MTAARGGEIDRGELLEARDREATIVDVLPRESFERGHIPGSIHLPLPEIRERAAEILPGHDAEVVVYCAGPDCDASEMATERLRELGWRRAVHYPGGLEEWQAEGGLLERVRHRERSPRRSSRGRLVDFLVTDRTIPELLLVWLGLAVSAGLVYWAGLSSGYEWLRGDLPGAGWSLESLAACVYFSFVTVLSMGYGDIAPLGAARVLALLEGAAGLLIFGLIISKLVSRRQEELLEETHDVAFEVRLGRIRTNLHLVLSELQDIAEGCRGEGPGRRGAPVRAESAVAVFEGELRAVHDLLYRPVHAPDEDVLEGILAVLAACLDALEDLLACLPAEVRSSRRLIAGLGHIHDHAVEICGDCVPRDFAPDLRDWMDRVQEAAGRLG